MALAGRSITILGAGIGGLAAAIALARRGAKVTVLEQAPEIAEVGAGLQITPNGAAVLAGLGLGRHLARIGVPLQAVELRDQGGGLVTRLDLTRARHGNPHGYFAVHRADLIEVLHRAALRHGVAILLGQKVTGVAIGFDQATLPVEDGPLRRCRLLVGADGVRSPTREAMNREGPPAFTGHAAWRAVVDSRLVPVWDPPPVATVHMGPGRHVVTYPLRGGRQINVVAVIERKDWVAEDWAQQDDPENLRRAFAGFSPAIRRLLSLCDEVFLWGLFRHPVAPVWSQAGTVLLGDALHPTLPFLAQGANMALEDAWVLAAELDRHGEPAEAFAAYRARREARVRRIVAQSTANANIYHASGPLKTAAVRGGLRALGRLAPAQLLGRFDWLYGHDVTAGD